MTAGDEPQIGGKVATGNEPGIGGKCKHETILSARNGFDIRVRCEACALTAELSEVDLLHMPRDEYMLARDNPRLWLKLYRAGWEYIQV